MARSSIRLAGCNGIWKAAERSRTGPVRHLDHDRESSNRMREMYRKEGGAFPDPILNLTWNYTSPTNPDPEEISRKKMNGRAIDGRGRNARRPLWTLRAGQLLDGFAQLRDDGATASGCWIFFRVASPKGATRWLAAMRPTPRETGHRPRTYWGPWAWPANRRILYNRASGRMPQERPGIPRRNPSSSGDGKQWVGIDVPDYGADDETVRQCWPVHHECRRRGPPVLLATSWSKARFRNITSRSSHHRRTFCIRKVSLEPRGTGVCR